jgi:hypothetical protein
MRVENVRIVGGSWLCWEAPSAVGSSDFESRGAGALTTTAREGGGDVQFKVPAHCGATRRSGTTTGDGMSVLHSNSERRCPLTNSSANRHRLHRMGLRSWPKVGHDDRRSTWSRVAEQSTRDHGISWPRWRGMANPTFASSGRQPAKSIMPHTFYRTGALMAGLWIT